MLIRHDDLTDPTVLALLREHRGGMTAHSPPSSIHALDVAGLRQRGITFWTAWEDNALLGCGALKQLDIAHGEIKSMRTAAIYRRRGMAARMLQHLLDEAGRRGYTRLSLETGSAEAFRPARSLYECFGFCRCAPFGAVAGKPAPTRRRALLASPSCQPPVGARSRATSSYRRACA